MQVKGVVSGGQAGDSSWVISDYRTKKVSAKGDDGIEGYGKAFASEQADRERWVHADLISEDMYTFSSPLLAEGLPDSLCEKLNEWAEHAEDDEITMLLGEERPRLTPRGVRHQDAPTINPESKFWRAHGKSTPSPLRAVSKSGS